MKEWFYDNWKKILLVIGFIVVLIVFIVLGNIFKPASQINCVFLNEQANLHEEYYITVTDFQDCETVSILKHEGDLEETKLISTDKHFIAVTVLIEHINVKEAKEDHQFDIDDFKLKDHTGVQIKNINLFSKENGIVLAKKEFTTVETIKDYNWINSNIDKGTQKMFTVYFEVPKNISTLDTVTVLEVDFFRGRLNGKAGTDIVLAKRNN